ncbi:MAG: AAA-like domain-containing protein [Rivularia sp. (in: cyanobacteria)]
MEFTLDEALKIANNIIYPRIQRNLSDVETAIIRGAWHKQDYGRIAEENNYTLSYISQDVAPKLWKLLSEVLGERVKKNNFKEALKRCLQDNSNIKENLLLQDNFGKEESLIITDNYINRPPVESICYQEILQPGALIRIKASWKMGKTCLMNKIFDSATKQSYKTVHLNLLQADECTIKSLDKLLRWLCSSISRRLKLKNHVADLWDTDSSSNDNCTAYFEDDILANIDTPLVLGLDNVDRVFKYQEVAADFFGLLRSWYEDANFIDEWKKLRLIVVHSTEVYIPLHINQSPFNVGLPVELPEFNIEQVQELAKQYGFKKDCIPLENFIAIVGGHPYLLHKAFTNLKNQPTVKIDDFLQTAATEAGLYRNHLLKISHDLHQDAKLIAAMRNVVEEKQPVRIDSEEAFKLHSMGLVRWRGNKIEPRCNLYRLYLHDCLLA